MLKIRIRTKLAAALAIPLAALVAISGFEALQASHAAADVRSETELATVSIGPSSLTTELQNERNYTALDLIGLADAATLEVSSVSEARDRVDAAVADLRTYLSGRGEVVSQAFAPAFAALEADLGATRQEWDDYDGPKDLTNQPLADDVFERFTTMTQAFFTATESVATEVDDNRLRNGIEIVDNSNRRGELLANITRLIVLDLLTDGNEAEYRSDVAVRVDRIDAAEHRIAQLSDGPYADVAAKTLNRPADLEARQYFDAYLAGETIDIPKLLAAVSAGGSTSVTSAAEMAADILDAQAAHMTAAADTRKQEFLLLAGGIIALAILCSWLASRSITRPLRRLRTEAAEMAANRLPGALAQILETPLGEDVVVPELDPIVVKTRDEVREVVEVLNDVQDRTLSLAADQAVLRRNIADSFVNLGRRNQNLLDRQLEFITELEQNETEPEELEALFRLDHLATRMRRNAESLLVLAGVESPRQWTAPVSMDDVIRAALGEVEEYRRVQIRNLEPAMVSGTAAAGISHVMAELIENALHFSPPDTPVEIKGRRNADGYVVAVDDDGIGMSAADLEHANRRLSGAESYTVAPSRYLGHYVAGNLAVRFGIEVRVQDSPAGGVTATVAVPMSLLDPTDSAPEPEAEPTASVASASVATIDGPATLAEALGTAELAAITSAEELTRAIEGRMEDAPAASATPSETDTAPTVEPADETPSGLPRRVPGAQRPELMPTVARREPEPASEAATAEPRATGSAFGFLSGYAAATTDDDRGLDRADPSTDDQAGTSGEGE